jgi:capsular polysaccharide biosynthesis protein
LVDNPPNDWDQGPGIAESIRRHKRLVVGGVHLGALLDFGWALCQPVRYEGTVRIFLDIRSERATVADRIVRSQAEFLSSPVVMDHVVKLLDGRLTRQQVEEQLTVEPVPDTDLITIRALDASGDGAVQLADTMALAYRQVVAKQARAAAEASVRDPERTEAQLEEELVMLASALRADPDSAKLQANHDAKLQQLQETARQKKQAGLDAERASRPGTLRERASIPLKPAQPKPIRNAAIGAVLGLVVGSALALWRTGSAFAAPAQAPGRPLDSGGRESAGQRMPGLGTALPAAFRPGIDRLEQSSSTASSNGSGSGIVDFDQLAASVQQVVHHLEGPRERLYEQNVPQMTAEETADQFPADLVVVLLAYDHGSLRVAGSVGLNAVERAMAIRYSPELMRETMEAGPRLVEESELTRLAAIGMPDSQVESLAILPPIQHGVGLGIALAGQRDTEEQPHPPNNRDLKGMATEAHQGIPSLQAWLRLRDRSLGHPSVSRRPHGR